MEAASLISKSTFTGAKGAEVLSRPGCDVSEELENDAALRGYRVLGISKGSHLDSSEMILTAVDCDVEKDNRTRHGC